MKPNKYHDEDYLQFDPCEGDEAEISCRTVKLVKARKYHPCFFGLGQYGDKHVINLGETYRYEKALIDGSFFGEYKVCTPCMDKYLDEINCCDEELTQ